MPEFNVDNLWSNFWNARVINKIVSYPHRGKLPPQFIHFKSCGKLWITSKTAVFLGILDNFNIVEK